MKTILLLLFGLQLTSCQYFEKQVPDEDVLLKERLQEIDWNNVSSYPSFPECDAITDKDLRKECFFSTLTRMVQEKLGADTVALLSPGLDTINLKVTVLTNSSFEFEPQFPADSTLNTKEIDSILKAKLVGFPHVEPANKEGVPVKCQFILPVVLLAP